MARDPASASGQREPSLLPHPPADLGITAPDAHAAERLRGRTVWLVHPWALRAPPRDLPHDALVIGIYPHEHHAAWPWPAARWRWVDAGMAEHTTERWHIDAASLESTLAGAAEVRSVADPHITPWLRNLARLDSAPLLFPQVGGRCTSFSQWWTRATRGLRNAEDLL